MNSKKTEKINKLVNVTSRLHVPIIISIFLRQTHSINVISYWIWLGSAAIGNTHLIHPWTTFFLYSQSFHIFRKHDCEKSCSNTINLKMSFFDFSTEIFDGVHNKTCYNWTWENTTAQRYAWNNFWRPYLSLHKLRKQWKWGLYLPE